MKNKAKPPPLSAEMKERKFIAKGIVRPMTPAAQWVTLLSLLLFSLAVHADYRDIPSSKLVVAKAYVEKFLAEDARPDQAFYQRDVKFPVWKDQPINDCAMHAIVRAIQAKEPYFENKSRNVVVVPVWVELLMVDVSNDGGLKVTGKEEGTSKCTFEYERYSFKTKRFEKIPGFRKRTHREEFFQWGESLERRNKLFRLVALDIDKRYVRFNFRVSVVHERPYQLAPQFPRHALADAVVAKLRRSITQTDDELARGISDRDSIAADDVLKKDLNRMNEQNFERRWIVSHLLDSLAHLHNITPFSEIAQ